VPLEARIATPPAAPAAPPTATNGAPPPPTIEVHIRSIEIHAAPPPAEAPRPAGISLDAFLARRGTR
jgi:hypothetical protein